MIFQEFRKAFFDVGCFTTAQVYAWRPGFDKNNLGRWVRKGLLVKLRQGHYSFPEYLDHPGFELFIANRIYKPSYVSLHSALAFYGLIPEAVVQTTSVTTLKTQSFDNRFGTFSYKSVKTELFFGYEIKPMAQDRHILMAKPEKALIDLLYLYPFYSSAEDMESLRLDEDVMHENIDETLMRDYSERFYSKALGNRVDVLLKTYVQ